MQADYFKSAYEGFVAQSTKVGQLYVELAQELYKPFETQWAKATCEVIRAPIRSGIESPAVRSGFFCFARPVRADRHSGGRPHIMSTTCHIAPLGQAGKSCGHLGSAGRGLFFDRRPRHAGLIAICKRDKVCNANGSNRQAGMYRRVRRSQSEAAATVPDVPGDEIFGFTTPTDVGNPGETGFANENDGRAGKRGGAYRALNAKYELGHTPAPDWWVGVSLFASHNLMRDVPGSPTSIAPRSTACRSRSSIGSSSGPSAIHSRSRSRSSRDGDGSTASRGCRRISSMPRSSFSSMRCVVPDKLFWGFNAIWAPQRAEDPATAAGGYPHPVSCVSTAIAYQWSPKFFLGAEVRYLGSFSTILPTHEVGHAVYAGPTLLWKVTDKVAFNTTFQPQIAGRSTDNPQRRLDLDNFEKAQFRAKLSIAFQ